MPSKGEKGENPATEAFSKLKLNAAADGDDVEDSDSQSDDSQDEEYEDQAPKSILRRVHGMRNILVSRSCYSLIISPF